MGADRTVAKVRISLHFSGIILFHRPARFMHDLEAAQLMRLCGPCAGWQA